MLLIFCLTVTDIHSISSIAVEKGKGYAPVRSPNIDLVLIFNLQINCRVNSPSQILSKRRKTKFKLVFVYSSPSQKLTGIGRT